MGGYAKRIQMSPRPYELNTGVPLTLFFQETCIHLSEYNLILLTSEALLCFSILGGDPGHNLELNVTWPNTGIDCFIYLGCVVLIQLSDTWDSVTRKVKPDNRQLSFLEIHKVDNIGIFFKTSNGNKLDFFLNFWRTSVLFMKK